MSYDKPVSVVSGKTGQMGDSEAGHCGLSEDNTERLRRRTLETSSRCSGFRRVGAASVRGTFHRSRALRDSVGASPGNTWGMCRKPPGIEDEVHHKAESGG